MKKKVRKLVLSSMYLCPFIVSSFPWYDIEGFWINSIAFIVSMTILISCQVLSVLFMEQIMDGETNENAMLNLMWIIFVVIIGVHIARESCIFSGIYGLSLYILYKVGFIDYLLEKEFSFRMYDEDLE